MNLEERIRLGLAELAGGDALPPGLTDRVLPRLAVRRSRLGDARLRLAGAALALVAVAVVTILVGSYLAAPLATTQPTGSNAASSQASPTTDTYADGVPRAIDGQPVYEGADELAHAHEVVGTTPFLVGGRLGVVLQMLANPCPATGGRYVVAACSGTFLAPPGDSGAAAGRPGPTAVSLFAYTPDPLRDYLGSTLVVRVHVHEPFPAFCFPGAAHCGEEAFLDSLIWVGPVAEGDHRADVVDALAGRYDDGLPRGIGGHPVLRGADAAAHAAATNDTTPFLIGGWLTYDPWIRFSCFTVGAPPWNSCGPYWLFSTQAGSSEPSQLSVTFGDVGFPPTGPLVLLVHVHDPRASECGVGTVRCDGTAVVDRVSWSGDAATDPRPLSVDRLDAALRSVDSNLGLHSVGGGGTDCGASLRSGENFIVSGGSGTEPTTTFAIIWPTNSARGRALAVAPGPPAAFEAGSIACTVVGLNGDPATYLYRWLAIDNVALQIKTGQVPTDDDRSLVERLADALEAQALPSP